MFRFTHAAVLLAVAASPMHAQSADVIGTAGDSAALAVARTCPHVRYGGRIVLRRIEPT